MIDSVDKKIIVPEGTDKEPKSPEQPKVPEKREVFDKTELGKLKAEVVTGKEKQEAENTLKKLEGDNKIPQQPEIQTNISAAIKELKRPEAVKKEIAKSYNYTEEIIKDSPNDKNLIARTAGKIMNRILS